MREGYVCPKLAGTVSELRSTSEIRTLSTAQGEWMVDTFISRPLKLTKVVCHHWLSRPSDVLDMQTASIRSI